MSIINPKFIAEEGIVYPVESYQIQQNGIDIEIDKVFEIVGNDGLILKDEKARLSEVREIEADLIMGIYEKDIFCLKAGKAYITHAIQKIKVPETMGATVIVRSSLNRCGCPYWSGWYDSGYQGPIGGVLRPRKDIMIEKGARIAQIIFFDADSASLYKGRYQEGG